MKGTTRGKKVHVSRGGMRANVGFVMEEALAYGVSLGLHRAFKYTDAPTGELLDVLAAQLKKALWEAIDERFSFEP